MTTLRKIGNAIRNTYNFIRKAIHNVYMCIICVGVFILASAFWACVVGLPLFYLANYLLFH